MLLQMINHHLKIQKDYNNKTILNYLYSSTEINEFKEKVEELFKKYNLEIPEGMFIETNNFKELLIGINKYLWKDIEQNENNNSYLYKILELQK